MSQLSQLQGLGLSLPHPPSLPEAAERGQRKSEVERFTLLEDSYSKLQLLTDIFSIPAFGGRKLIVFIKLISGTEARS